MSRKKPKKRPISQQPASKQDSGVPGEAGYSERFSLKKLVTLRQSKLALFAVLLSVGSSIFLPFLLLARPVAWSLEAVLVFTAALGFILILPGIMLAGVIVTVGGPFGAGLTWRMRVALCITGYLATLLIFASGYYMMQTTGDYNRAVNIQNRLNNNAEFPGLRIPLDNIVAGAELDCPLKNTNFRAFVGFHEDRDLLDDSPLRRHMTESELEELAKNKRKSPARMNRGTNCAGLWLECLHFSIVTAATVGYGDIVPQTLMAKMVADCQIISSTAMLVFSFGFILSGKGSSVPV